MTYEPFLKKLQKKSNPNIRLESIPGAYGLRTARTRAVRPNVYDRHDFQITVFTCGLLHEIGVARIRR